MRYICALFYFELFFVHVPQRTSLPLMSLQILLPPNRFAAEAAIHPVLPRMIFQVAF
jgi:hypothetical protein